MVKKILVIVVILICAVGFSDHKKRNVVLSPKAPAPIGPYSQGILAGETLYVSGQIALRPDGSLDTSNIESECRQVLENIKAILEAGGKNLKDVSKSTIYLTDLKNFGKINGIYQAYFATEPPARETLEVKALPKGAHLEISVIAN